VGNQNSKKKKVFDLGKTLTFKTGDNNPKPKVSEGRPEWKNNVLEEAGEGIKRSGCMATQWGAELAWKMAVFQA